MASTRAQVRERKGFNRRVLPADRGRRAGDISGIVLDGRRADMQLGRRLLDATLERTIEGPNTLTLSIWDRDNAVLSSGVLGERVMASRARVDLDGLGWIAASVSRSEGVLSVVFEDEVFRILKRHGVGKPLKVVRGTATTRASFCAQMIRAAGVPVIVLDERVVQPIARGDLKTEVAKAKGQTRERGRTRTIGATGSDLTIKGAPATQEQRRNVATALAVAERVDAGETAVLAMLVAGIGESNFQVIPNTEGSPYGGVFQGKFRADANGPAFFAIGDTAGMAESFLLGGRGFQQGGAIKLARENPGMTPGEIATRVEASGKPGSFYQDHIDEARRWLRAAGNDFTGGGGGGVEVEDFTYERRKNESTYAACRRLLDEVRWRMFAREGVVILAHDLALMRATASLEIEEGTEEFPGFLDFDWARALRVGEASGSVYARRYQADPGEPVDVVGLPQTHRTWLLATTSQSLMARTGLVDVTLRKPQQPAAEPANETETTSTDGGGGGGSGEADSLYAACAQIHAQKLPYVWGGGHARAGTPDGGTGRDPGTGYDCSGAVGAALAMVGWGYEIGEPIPGSGDMAASWGEPGEGRTHTLWANAAHVFLELRGGAMKSFNTSGGYKGEGPRLRANVQSTAGFIARHWPGH